MRPPSLYLSPYSNFFSSLKQVEKRLKLESQTPPQPQPPNDTSTESLSTPIYVNTDHEFNTSSSKILQESSELPSAFLSSSYPQSLAQNPCSEIPQEQTKAINQAKINGLDDIQLLMQLLGISDFELVKQGQEQEEAEEKKEKICDELCECEGEFYEKIVGVKGPKCKKEVGRLERWIRYFLQNGEGEEEEKMEPLRLAFLLLGKAATDGGGFGGLEFPSTIEEYLKYDPQQESN